MQLGFDPEKITLFARTNARGQDVQFGIKAKDRQRHMYVIGKTGMGKSTLLENMAAQDIQSGEGMCFIDPHGSAIETLLEYVPEHRLDDVVYFAPFDMDYPISFNIMEDVGPDTRHLVVSGLMSTFKKIWEDAWSARMEYILTNALLALIEYPDTTLLSVNRMLADKAYRDKVVDYVKDPAVKAYWVDEFASYTERFAAEALPAIQNKIGQFTGNPLIRNIIGQPKSSFDVRKMMDEKKILLVNLSKGLVGETNADLLGSMLITKIYLAAMSRAELPPAQMKQMPNFYFYVDEFQSFANSTFANILSEARKYHLNLIIAHQYVDQMEETVRNAVFGNVGTTIAFRVGPFDAEVLEPIFTPPFLANDLVNLGFAQIYLTLMIDGVGSTPFSAKTLPPVETPSVSHREMVIARSRKNFCQPRGDIQKLVENLHAPDDRIDAAVAGTGGNQGGFTKPSGFHKVGTDKNFVKQKDRLKQGLPRQKGPAQTPPGTKSPDTAAGKQQSSPNKPTATERDNQPVGGGQKSPDDLRAILAKMAGGDKQTTPQTEPKKPTPTPVPERTIKERAAEKPATKQSDQNKNQDTHRQQHPSKQSHKNPCDQRLDDRQTQRSQDKVAVGDASHKQELQAILAKLSDNKNSQEQSVQQREVRKDDQPRSKQSSPKAHLQKNQLPQKQAPQQPQPQTAQHYRPVAAPTPASTPAVQPSQKSETIPTPTTVTPSLRDELQQIVARASGATISPSRSESTVVEESRPVTPHPAEVVATASDAPQTQPLKTKLAPAPVANTETPVRPAAAIKPIASPAPATPDQPAYTPHVEPAAPDLQTVKKILKHSGTEHPPGLPR